MDDDHRKLQQIDEICLASPNNSTASTCKEFLRRYKDHAAGVYVYGDPAGNQRDTRSETGSNDYSIIKSQLASMRPSMRVKSSAPSVVGRGQFINAVLAGELPSLQLVVGKNCVKTVADYCNLKEAAEGGKDKRKVTDPNTGTRYEPFGHCSDANDYFICWVLESEFIRYTKGGSRTRRVSSASDRTSML